MDVRTLIYLLLLFLPLFLIILIPYIIGRKKLLYVRDIYLNELFRILKQYNLRVKEVSPPENLLYYHAYLLALGGITFRVTLSLMDRRYYFYYLVRRPDLVQIRVYTDGFAPFSFLVIPKEKKDTLQKLSGYITEMKAIPGVLSKDFVAVTDDLSVSSVVLTPKIRAMIRKLGDDLNWLYIDYAQPIIEIRSDLTENNVKRVLNLAFALSLELIDAMRKVKKRSEKGRALDIVRKILEEV